MLQRKRQDSERGRRAEPVIYVSSDASYRDGLAGIAYHGDQLGSDARVVECRNSSEAELRALLLGMAAAERAGLAEVTFKTDDVSAAQPDLGESEQLRPLREQVTGYLARHSTDWRIERVRRGENGIANRLAREVLSGLRRAQ